MIDEREREEVFGLGEPMRTEYSKVISHMLIPELIRIADKYNVDRDSMIKYTADMLTAVSEVSTFVNWEDKE